MARKKHPVKHLKKYPPIIEAIEHIDKDRKRTISFDALEKRTEAYIALNPPNDERAVKKLIESYDGREVIIKTATSNPRYLHGKLVKESTHKGCFGIGFPDRTLVVENQPYSELIEMIVLRQTK